MRSEERKQVQSGSDYDVSMPNGHGPVPDATVS